MKIVHISKYKRHGAHGVHLGGVAKFAMYLQWAVSELEIYAWEDFPDWQKHELGTQDWEKAPLLNEWLLGQGIVDENTIVVSDGWWGLGLEGRVARLISVCHGSYAGAMVEHLKNPWDDGFLLGQSVRHQEKFWRESGCEIVAVSRNAARELRLLSGLHPTITIQNGIDLEIFTAKSGPPRHDDLILEVTNGHPAKGAKIIEELKGRGYNIEPFGVRDGNLEHEAARWSEAWIAIFPSYYEGFNYALAEAMACRCKIVGYWTGFVPDILHPHKAGEFTDDHHVTVFAHAIDMARICAYETGRFTPNYDTFAEKWRAYLENPN